MGQDNKETDHQQVDQCYQNYSEFHSVKDKDVQALPTCCMCLQLPLPQLSRTKTFCDQVTYCMLWWLCQLLAWKCLGQHIQAHGYCIGSSLATKLLMAQTCLLKTSGPQSGSSVTITTVLEKVATTTVFPGEHRGARCCSQNISYIFLDATGRVIVYVSRLHRPAVEILMGPMHGWI